MYLLLYVAVLLSCELMESVLPTSFFRDLILPSAVIVVLLLAFLAIDPAFHHQEEGNHISHNGFVSYASQGGHWYFLVCLNSLVSNEK